MRRILTLVALLGSLLSAQTRPWVERSDWDDNLAPAGADCRSFPTAYYAAWGEVKVTKVTGRSNIKPGDTQQINPGAFRLDQFSQERQRFACEMVLAFQANQIKGTVVQARAELNRPVTGRLTIALLSVRGPDLTSRIVATAEGGAEITREGQLHAIPLGFATSEQFQKHSAIMRQYLGGVLRKLKPVTDPLGGVQVYVMGSSVKGRSSGDPKKGKPPGVPFDGKNEPSDIDMGVVSPELFAEGKRLGCNTKEAGRDSNGQVVYRISENCEELEGRQRSAAGLGSGHPELGEMRNALSVLLTPNLPERLRGYSRPVNYVVVTAHPVGLAEIAVPGFQ